MKITISNLRGIPSATIETAPPTLIAGANFAGKTSLLRFIRAAITNTPVPIDGIRKTEGMVFVDEGRESGTITVEDKRGTTTVTYPSMERTVEGAGIEISKYAAGTISLIDSTAKERSDTICKLLKSEPSEADLTAAFSGLNVPEKYAGRLWGTICTQGWDAAWSQAKEKGIKLKGQWEGYTSERYGSEKALEWLPKDWMPDLNDTTELPLRDAIQQEREWLEAAISSNAVSAVEIERLTSVAADIGKLKTEAKTESDTIAGLIKNETDLIEAERKIPSCLQPVTVSCPHCKKPVMIENGKLIIPKAGIDAEIKKRKESLAKCIDSLRSVRAILETHRNTAADIAQKLHAAEDAQNRLVEIKNKPVPKTGMGNKVDDCRARLARAEARLSDFQLRDKCRGIAEAIAYNKNIIDVLSPTGLRLEKLQSALDRLNKTLLDLSAAAGWKTVAINGNLTITYGDEMFILKSESEKYRARVTLQVAMAMWDKSEYVIIDSADILDNTGRNGLFKMLLASGRCGIVAMTINKRENIPPVEKVGGVAYWIEKGIAYGKGGVK
jgi:hypothetical protein